MRCNVGFTGCWTGWGKISSKNGDALWRDPWFGARNADRTQGAAVIQNPADTECG